jgi:hypothetical protein
MHFICFFNALSSSFYAPSMHLPYSSYTFPSLLSCSFYAPSMHFLCSCFTILMLLLYFSYVPYLLLLRSFYASSMLHLYSSYTLPLFYLWLFLCFFHVPNILFICIYCALPLLFQYFFNAFLTSLLCNSCVPSLVLLCSSFPLPVHPFPSMSIFENLVRIQTGTSRVCDRTKT